ncbi:NADH dehydrogenase [ubiquinone] 1 alpha subcomplex subunit 6-like [Ochlerotatus camptorhynchus]|uniref:NADH dehydrogenase [ubiquinone] 1 alpha subcomplex subunit 6-like n=1 Tax=Ochlerotatus camptorhynchus TaxID=644619 RepID=UPI0031CF8909
MSAGKIINESVQYVRPLLSMNHQEAHRKVLKLYKTWYRQLPQTVYECDIPKSLEQCRQKLREEFLKHRNVTDLRVIDMLVIKGQMELKETSAKWKQKSHLMRYWKDTQVPKAQDFLSKFYTGHD